MIVLLSGGLDSVAAWRLLDLPPAVHFDIGTQSVPRERQALVWARCHFDADVTYRNLPMGDYECDNGYIPFRNPLLILAAAQLDPEVVIGQVAEWAPDKNRRFYRRLEKSVNRRGTLAGFEGGLKVRAPFAGRSKGELLATYRERFGTHETQLLLQHTWSCYRDERLHCGHCGGCNQRYCAEAQYATLTGESMCTEFASPPPFLKIPNPDNLRWIADNGLLGVAQIFAHHRQVHAGEVARSH